MNYSTKSDTDLLQILDGSRGRIAEDSQNGLARKVFDAALAEALKRGLVNARSKARIKAWTASDVEDLMAPFIELTRTVPDNARLKKGKGFTQAGGGKLRGELWIDAYTAIQARGIDAEVGGYVAKKGDVPTFVLRERLSPDAAERAEIAHFTVATLLEEALPRWRELTRKAGGKA